MPIFNQANMNESIERRIKDGGADFVRFVDISGLDAEANQGFERAVIFGKALSKEYIRDIRALREPKHKEVFNVERKMDALAVKIAIELEAEGYKSLGKLKTGVLPHKTVALRAGLGFIGKNNLLVTPQYGCAQMLGKVLTDAPVEASSQPPMPPECSECTVCEDVCPEKALLGTTWSLGVTREEMLTRKKCTLCVKCMACCPFTVKYSR